MELFKQLSSVGQQALLVVTHATRSLELADRLFVLARGGHLCFSGKPEQAKNFFDVSSYDDIYAALDSRPADEWRHEFETSSPAPAEQLPTGPPPQGLLAGMADGKTLRSTAQQSGVLSARYYTVFTRDVRNVLILLLQTPLIALAMALLFKPEVFAPPGRGIASSAAQLLFVLVVTTIWLGTLASAREIIKERPVFERERAVGVGVPAYVVSKLAVLFPLVAVQAAVLMVVVFGLRPLHDTLGTYAALLTVLVLTGFCRGIHGLVDLGRCPHRGAGDGADPRRDDRPAALRRGDRHGREHGKRHGMALRGGVLAVGIRRRRLRHRHERPDRRGPVVSGYFAVRRVVLRPPVGRDLGNPGGLHDALHRGNTARAPALSCVDAGD